MDSTLINKKTLGKASTPAVNQYLQLAYAQHIEVKALLKNLSINESLLTDHDQTISGEQFQTLIAELLKHSQDPLFGLHTAKYVQPGSYSVLGFLVMNCETLGEAITKIQPFEKLVGDMGNSELIAQDELLTLRWHCNYEDPLVKQHMVDNVLASWLHFAHYLTDNQGQPEQIHLTRSTPSLSIQAEYQQTFNCTVLYEQKYNEILFKKNLLQLPLNKGNKQLVPTLEKHAEKLVLSLKQTKTIQQKCKEIIHLYLSSRKVTQEFVALQLKTSSKTLQRKLKKEHCDFKTLLNEERLIKAKHYLINTSKNMTQISQALGFSETRSFYRWFQKQTTLTPGKYKKNNQKK